MSEKNKKLLGFAWLKFFCYWRPWIYTFCTIVLLGNIIMIEEYKTYYLSNTFGIISIIFSIINMILLLILFFLSKSKNKYALKIISWELLFEVINFSYFTTLQITNKISNFFPYFIIFATIYFIIWYGLNIKYFRKRDFFFSNESNIKDKEPLKVIYCKKCGGKLNQFNKCSSCGKQYLTKSKLTIILLSIAFAISMGFNIYNINIKNSYEKSLNNLIDIYGDLSIENIDNKEKLKFFDEKIVFVIEGYGNYYYSYECMHQIDDEEYSFWAYNIEQAESLGYKRGSC